MPNPPPPPDDRKPGDGRPGRRPRISEQIIAVLAAKLLEGQFRVVACRSAGISPVTLRRWMGQGRRFPDGVYGRLRTVVLRAEADCEARSVKLILIAGEDDPSHLEWYLERKYPQRYGRYRGELGELKRQIKQLEALVAEIEREQPAAPEVDR